MKNMNENVTHTSEEEYHTMRLSSATREEIEKKCKYYQNEICTNSWHPIMAFDKPVLDYCRCICKYKEIKDDEEVR